MMRSLSRSLGLGALGLGLAGLAVFMHAGASGEEQAGMLNDAARTVDETPLLERLKPVAEAELADPPASDWLTYRANFGSWGYSKLDQIGKRNVSGLSLAWVASMEGGPNQATPLARNGVLFLPNPGDVIQALDGRTGATLWQYSRQMPGDINLPNESGGTLSLMLHAIKRNIAIDGERLFTSTGDGKIVAIDYRTGQQIWETEAGDYHEIVSTAGPIVAAGLVISGRSCDASFPGGCYVLANDVETGKEVWRRYLIARPGEPGDETWNGIPLERRRHVGAWGIASYDPAEHLLYIGTSVPTPSVEIFRGTEKGDALYSNSTLALDVRTGKIVWYFQHLPRDNWDLDHVYERILIDTPVAPAKVPGMTINPDIPGARTRVLTGVPGKTGIIWTLDRKTGKFIWARPTITQNVISSIDPRSGKVTVNPDQILKTPDGKYPLSCPGAYGGKNWPVSAYSPQTNAMYLSLNDTCQDITVRTTDPQPADLYGLDFSTKTAGDKAHAGWLEAVSAETGKTLWRHQQPGRIMSVLATAGGLIFAGDSAGRFMAFDAADGALLWATQLHTSVTGTPIAYEVDGVEYIAVAVGPGNGVSDTANKMSGIALRGSGNMIYAFRLPQKQPAAPLLKAASTADTAIRLAYMPMLKPDVAAGRQAYATNCAACHGQNMRGSGHASALTGCAFKSRWAGQSLASLYGKIISSMPPGANPPLSDKVVADILAYWLSTHNAPAALTRSGGAWIGTNVDAVPGVCN